MEPAFLLFASDATLLAAGAAVLLVVAALAWLGQWRRDRRRHPDSVGWIPWTPISVFSAFAAFVLLAFAVQGWLTG
jgi:hypothetical protein